MVKVQCRSGAGRSVAILVDSNTKEEHEIEFEAGIGSLEFQGE